MNQLYVLQVASTGETFYQGVTDQTIVQWWRTNERRLLHYKRTPQRFKDAVAANDTIVGWVNYDELRRANLTHEQKAAEVHRVFRNFDKYYEKRLQRDNRATSQNHQPDLSTSVEGIPVELS